MGLLTKIKTEKTENGKITPAEDITKLKIDLMRRMPFYGDIIVKLPIVEMTDDTVPTAATNGKVILYNKKYMESLPSAQRHYVIMHEVFHVLLMHWKRNQDRIPIYWNVACDYVVNQMLVSMIGRFKENGIDIQIPPDICMAQYCVLSAAEDVYYKIVDDNKDNNSKDKVYVRKMYSNLKNDQKELLDKRLFPKDLTVKPARNLSDKEQSDLESEIKKLIKDSASKNRGTYGSSEVPREILRIVESRMLPWHKYLSKFLQQVETGEASYLNPERKYIHMDLMVPGNEKRDDDLGGVWAFIDSSGSIAQNELDQYLTQLYRISKEFGCEINVAYWDTKVTDVYTKVKKPNELLDCRPKHSGGTNINCIYEYLKNNKIKPYVMLILTDGFFGDADELNKKRNRKKTILVLTDKHGDDMDLYASFGKVAML